MMKLHCIKSIYSDFLAVWFSFFRKKSQHENEEVFSIFIFLFIPSSSLSILFHFLLLFHIAAV